jgi:hypothetical protein
VGKIARGPFHIRTPHRAILPTLRAAHDGFRRATGLRHWLLHPAQEKWLPLA